MPTQVLGPGESPRKKAIALKATNLRKSYGRRTVVKDLDLEVHQGEIVGLLGPNGAGKTTSFYMIAGLVRADVGQIELAGEDVTEDPIHLRAAKGIGYLPQEASIFRDLSVEENIYAVLEVRAIPNLKRKNNLEYLLKDFDLEKIRHSRGRDLSGGERRRVEVARTLALDPRFILLDEPFAGVDPLSVGDIQEIIKRLKKRNIGVLITDHNVRETFGIVDRAYIMNDGKLLIEGPPKDIMENKIVRESYLGKDFSL